MSDGKALDVYFQSKLTPEDGEYKDYRYQRAIGWNNAVRHMWQEREIIRTALQTKAVDVSEDNS